MSPQLGPPWRSRRPLGRPRSGWARIEEMLQEIHDDAWCFLGDDGERSDAGLRRAPRPGDRRDRTRD